MRLVTFSGFDDSTQHSRGAVELEWDLGEKITRHSDTCGSWELAAASELFRLDRSEKRPAAP